MPVWDFAVLNPAAAWAAIVGVVLAGFVVVLLKKENANWRRMRNARLRNQIRLKDAEDRGYQVVCTSCREIRRENERLRLRLEVATRRH